MMISDSGLLLGPPCTANAYGRKDSQNCICHEIMKAKQGVQKKTS